MVFSIASSKAVIAMVKARFGISKFSKSDFSKLEDLTWF